MKAGWMGGGGGGGPPTLCMNTKIILGPITATWTPKSWSLSTYAHLKGQTICTSMHIILAE